MTIAAGALAPECFRLSISNLENDDEPLDLETVSAVAFQVDKPGGERETWTAEVIEQSSAALLVEHAFDAADVEHAGRYLVEARLTVPDGTRRTVPVFLQVI